MVQTVAFEWFEAVSKTSTDPMEPFGSISMVPPDPFGTVKSQMNPVEPLKCFQMVPLDPLEPSKRFQTILVGQGAASKSPI